MFVLTEDFWRNWFYRVQIILTAYGLEMPKNRSSSVNSNKPRPKDTTAIFIEEGDYLNKDIEKELSALGIHTAESNPDAWEEELKKELSVLDASKDSSLLSQNWEEELMLELGLKEKDTDTTATDTVVPLPHLDGTATIDHTQTNINVNNNVQDGESNTGPAHTDNDEQKDAT